MAQKVSVLLVDDLDGSEAHETVTFGLDGSTYEIDLNKANAESFRETVQTWVSAARKVNNRRKAKGKAGDTRTVREWARANGFKVSNRGVIPAEVQAAYEAAAH